MAGILKIHSRAAESGRLGHSWIEYCPIDGVPVTFGTWGNNPTGQGNGLLVDTEATFKADATRSRIIDYGQEQRLFEVINDYRRRGEQAWTLRAPCSTFAAEAWEYATGERLIHQTALISNPGRLVRSIAVLNRRDGPAIPVQQRSSATTASVRISTVVPDTSTSNKTEGSRKRPTERD